MGVGANGGSPGFRASGEQRADDREQTTDEREQKIRRMARHRAILCVRENSLWKMGDHFFILMGTARVTMEE